RYMSETSPSHKGEKEAPPFVLLVEDNPVTLKLLDSLLGKAGCQVYQARDVRQAQVLLNLRRFRFVVLDMLLPDTSGIELARWMRRNPELREIPILFFTACSDPKLVREAAQISNVDYLLKPLRQRVFLDRVEKILRSGRVPDRGVQVTVSSPTGPEGEEGTLLSQLKIPSFQESTIRLFELVNDEDATVKEFAEVVEQDPGLTATVLKLVNSAFYGLPRKVDSISVACALIGLRDLGSACLSAALAQEMTKGAIQEVQECWSHCIATGQVARKLVEVACPKSQSVVSSAGLLNGIGLITLLGSDVPGYEKVLEEAEKGPCNWAEVERKHLKIDFLQVGLEVARTLSLNDRVCTLIGRCEQFSAIESVDLWCVVVASLAVQQGGIGLQRRADPAADLKLAASQYPSHWKDLEDAIPAMVEQARLQNELLLQDVDQA
ncbi:MAG: HDOD domain-containing protein, partial [Planctomycetota bacterium]